MPPTSDAASSTELIAGVAVKWRGEVHSLPSPARHIDVIMDMAAKGYPPGSTLIQGFVTTAARFVDRKEAFRLAQNGGQIKDTPRGPPDLHSEDMW
jgi:hypothetical protein